MLTMELKTTIDRFSCEIPSLDVPLLEQAKHLLLQEYEEGGDDRSVVTE